MRKLHLDQCHSTQDVLLEQLKSGNVVDLVSTELQTQGRGRHENLWHQLGHTLCFSFICAPNDVLTLTSLEMSELVCQFFQRKFQQNLMVKWPNDILDQAGRKCAGILVNQVEHKSAVGIGLNLFSDQQDAPIKSDYPVGYIFNRPIQYNRSELAQDIYQFILNNRLTSSQLRQAWEQRCIHLNQPVLIIDGSFRLAGNFVGIGNHGEALIESGQQIHKIYNGHLRIQN